MADVPGAGGEKLEEDLETTASILNLLFDGFLVEFLQLAGKLEKLDKETVKK